MQKIVQLITILALSCQTPQGPKPSMAMFPKERERVPHFRSFLVAPFYGKTDAKLTAAFLTRLTELYSHKVVIFRNITDPILTEHRLQQELPLFFLGYYLNYFRKPPGRSKEIAIPSAAFAQVSAKLRKSTLLALLDYGEQRKELLEAYNKQKVKGIRKAYKKNVEVVALLEQFTQAVINEAQVDYIMLCQVYGDEKSYKKGKWVTIRVGLVNVKTGKFRLDAQIKRKKGKDGKELSEQVVSMVNTILIDL